MSPAPQPAPRRGPRPLQAAPHSAARQPTRPEPRRCARPQWGHGAPGTDPGALRADRPRAGRRGFLCAAGARLRARLRSLRSAPAPTPPPRPTPPCPPPAAAVSTAPLLLRPGQWGAATQGGGPSPPTQSPAPDGEGAPALSSLRSAQPHSGAHGREGVKGLIGSARRRRTGCRRVSQSVHHGGGGAGCWRVLADTPRSGEAPGEGSRCHARLVAAAGSGGLPGIAGLRGGGW